MGWRLAVDIGGTFTDVVALEEATGRMHLLKVRSTPGDPSQGFVEAIDQILQAASIPAAEVAGVFHGTTVATNAILERKYDVLGLIITRGYREALECARQTVPGEFGDITWWIKPPRVVPLELVRETSARMDVQGREMRPVKPEEITAIARDFKARKIRAIAVSLLHSYRNPDHEEEVRRLVQAAYPECRISISSEIITKRPPPRCMRVVSMRRFGSRAPAAASRRRRRFRACPLPPLCRARLRARLPRPTMPS